MESVIIAAPAGYEPELRARLERLGNVTVGAGGVLVVEDARTRVYFVRNDGVRAELDSERLQEIVATIAQPVFYIIDFSDIALCRVVLHAIADDSEIVVDNDHGTVLRGSDFIRVLRSQPDWDWRSDEPCARAARPDE